MTIEEVKKFLADNKDDAAVKEFIGSIATVDERAIIDKYKASAEHKKELSTEGDRRVTAAIEKFQKETMPKHVEEEIKKRFPDETAEQKAIRELTAKLEAIEGAKKREEMKNKATHLFNEKKIPLEFSEYVNSSDEEELTKHVENLAALVDKIRIGATNEILKNGPTPPKSHNAPPAGGQWTRADLSDKTPEEIAKATAEGKLNSLIGRPA